MEGVTCIFRRSYGKGGDTADDKIVLSICNNIVHLLMSALAGFFVCKGEYRVYFCFAHDICVYLVTVLEMFGNKFGDTFLMGSFKTNC